MAGRIIIREDRLAGLDWTDPCPIPWEQSIPTEPPMFFCVRHHDAIIDLLYEMFDAQGLIDHDIVAGPPDAFDAMIESLMQGEGPLQ